MAGSCGLNQVKVRQQKVGVKKTDILASNFLLDGFETENFHHHPRNVSEMISISGTTYNKLSICIQFRGPLDLATGYLGSISENTDAFQRRFSRLPVMPPSPLGIHGRESTALSLSRVVLQMSFILHSAGVPQTLPHGRTPLFELQRRTLQSVTSVSLREPGKDEAVLQIRGNIKSL